MARNNHVTTYSEKIKGNPGNYGWQVRFDLADGYLGITQFDGETVKDRVLLSPAQIRELVNFTAGKKVKQIA
jgi:hypothetical protein